MKKIVRITESDLQRIVKRVIKENEIMDNYGDFNYDINTFDCGDKVMSGTVDIDEDGTIMINYCRGNEVDLEYLKEKGRRLIGKMRTDFNKIGGRVINESDEKTIDDNKIVKTIDDSKITKKIKGSLGANGGRFLFQVHTKLKTGGFAFLHPDYNKNKKLVFIPIDELGTGLPMVGTWLIDGTKLTLKES